MADLEELALRRDKKFLVRLIVALAAGLVVGAFLFAKLTSTEVGDCGAGMMGFEADAGYD